MTHVFCFAYYVEPPPTSGTIVVRKEVTGAPAGTNETFGFAGNISYNPGGRFSRSVKGGSPAAETFLRGATGPSHQPWTVRELGVPDWRLADLACVSRDHTSSVESSVASGEASIHLGAGDLVTCTYSDRYDPPPHRLTLRKVTEGGVGHFSYTVTPVGGGDAAHAVATTTEEDIAAAADPAPLDLAGGRYGVTEQMPSSSGGRWVLKAIECDGDSKPIDQPIEVSVPDRSVVSCTFRNAFIPRGEITISKITQGDVGTSSFLITRMSEEVAEYQQSAKTTKQGVPVGAHGDDTDRLELAATRFSTYPHRRGRAPGP